VARGLFEAKDREKLRRPGAYDLQTVARNSARTVASSGVSWHLLRRSSLFDLQIVSETQRATGWRVLPQSSSSARGVVQAFGIHQNHITLIHSSYICKNRFMEALRGLCLELLSWEQWFEVPSHFGQVCDRRLGFGDPGPGDGGVESCVPQWIYWWFERTVCFRCGG
jgi:hypothetical protein